VGPILANAITGITGMTMPPDFDYSGMSYAQAKRHYEAQRPIKIQFEEGAATGEPSGAPVARFSRSFSAWPIPGSHVTRYYLHGGGGLRRKPVPHGIAAARPHSFSADPSALPPTDFTGTDAQLWGAHPAYHWRQNPKGTGVGWITRPFRRTAVVIGSGSLDVWVKSSTPDVDLEATVSDVRPNGTEVYVQSGWLRASHRALDRARSTPTLPVHTDLASDARPMPAGRFRRLRLEILPFAQPFRAGDRLRITLDAPGGAKPRWAFDTIDHGQKVTIATDRRHRSSLALSFVPGVAVPAGRPHCGSLRSQPCRSYPG
jgi:predicted acyl esterase